MSGTILCLATLASLILTPVASAEVAPAKPYADIVSEVWQDLDGKTHKEQSYSKGKLYWGASQSSFLSNFLMTAPWQPGGIEYRPMAPKVAW